MSIKLNYNLSTIGKVNESALRGQKCRTDQDKLPFQSISYDFLSMLMGFIDGDGLRVYDTVKYQKKMLKYLKLNDTN